MRKIIYALIPIIAILFFSVGCSDDVINEEPIIKVEGLVEEGVNFTNVAENKDLTVTVDTGGAFTAQWSNAGTVVWGEVTANATGVKISVKENTSENVRTGLVTLTTTDKRTTRLIKVHQNTPSVSIEILPNNLEFNQLSGSKTITINTDAVGKWSISNDNDWITVTERVEFNEAIITVTENTGDARVAKLVVTAAGNKMEFTVTQNEPMDLLLPFLDFKRYDLEGGNVKDSIKKFELARGGQYAGLGWMGDIQYRTLSPNFPEIWYTVSRWNNFLSMIIMQPNNYKVLDSPDFTQLILDAGFEFVYTSETGIYTHYWRADNVELRIDRPAGEVQFFYPEDRPLDPGQKEDLPTFDVIPTGFSDWSATKPVIMAWEEEQGGTLKADFPVKDGAQQFLYKTNKTDPRVEFERSYWMDERVTPPQFMQTMLMYKDFTLAYFLSIDGDYYLTKEFRKLMADNGFEHIKPEYGGAEFFHSESKNLYILPEIVQYDDGSGVPETTLWITRVKADNPPFSSPGTLSMQILR